jgi:hypothetical protein
MTIAEQLKAIAAVLRPWAERNRSSVTILSDQVHLLELLRLKPGAVLIGLLFESETVRGEWDNLGRVDRAYKVIVTRGRGLKLDSGESLVGTSSEDRPVFELVEEARELVRTAEIGEVEGRPEYRGIGQYELQGAIFDGWEVRFVIGTAIPELVEGAS